MCIFSQIWEVCRHSFLCTKLSFLIGLQWRESKIFLYYSSVSWVSVYFFNLFFLSVLQILSFLLVYLQVLWLFHLLNSLLNLPREYFLFHVFSNILFNSKICIWFFFLVPVSLPRTYISPFISKICLSYLREHGYDSCLRVFGNFNIWVTLEWHLVVIFPLWKLVTFFWFFIYWAILNCILHILSTIL